MKKIISILSLGVIFLVGLLIFGNIYNKWSIVTDIDGIKYAITLNGESVTSFPSGNYKVEVNCNNAYGFWDSLNEKIIVKNISGEVACNVSFASISSNDNLNNYIISLSGSSQGLGKVVHDTAKILDYSDTNVITSYGTTPVYFKNSSQSSIAQTVVDDYWTYNGTTGVFTSDTNKMATSGNGYYHVYAKIASAGYYQICYTINNDSASYERLFITTNNNSGSNVRIIKSALNSQIGEECYHLGYLTGADYINISEKGLTNDTPPVINFRIESIPDKQGYIGYRYQGNKPNNYVLFNDELWRIIGVISTEYDSDEDGIVDDTANLVKIIRNEPIGSFIISDSYTNNWPDTLLYHLLNYEYYDWNTNKGTVSSYCYGYLSTPTNCDYSIKGIKDGYRDMIMNVKWYLCGPGKSGYSEYSFNNVYIFERDHSAVYNDNVSEIISHIGLIYPSDFMHSVLVDSCNREDNYISSSCSENNWLRGLSETWTISPVSSSYNLVWSLDYDGLLIRDSNSQVSTSNITYPTLYLSPSVYRVSGTGTITDPYIIGMAR